MSNFTVNSHQECFNKEKLKVVGILTFLIGFGQAILIYIMSTYFSQAARTENVGIFYLLAYVFEFFILFNLHKLISFLGHSRAFLLVVFAKIPILALLTVLDISFFGIIALISYMVIGSLAWVILDMIIESCSIDRLSGRIRGAHLTVLNAGFIFGPFLSTHLLDSFGYQGVFGVMIVLYSLIFLIAILGLRNFQYTVIKRSGFFEIVQKVKKRKNICRIYYISFVLEFFYSLMVIYTPLYLQGLGFSWEEIGIIFTFMLLPFIIFQFPVGYLADREMGEKEMIIFSLFVMSFSVAAIYFIDSLSILVWSMALFITRIGAACLEILRDSYFYKRIDRKDIDLIDFFRTTRPAAYITGAVLTTFLLFTFPIKIVFLLIALVVFSAIVPAWKLIDNKSEKEMIG